ncbi:MULTISPECIES: response regulator [Bosea]|uniref:response regulator n=1 Tax=Bosea TaxID=85413 RepID=UPI00214FF69F|nr:MULTISPECIES: response regulator [Bosea]MCR4522096.1 response regulator [Bosea sp. 47.2.35]MDR6829426.1 DNA-binding response OmpR family regulator [Bosea robiniae]MDR6896309.1 DNA-binding response OmpR family regulator [Bosea sp. BE109]MDR7139707.1 DNA-binding response OmpR family regulator [Bosea sp. BE168]MDR7176571.1 DNA-binding response OmpR family regulator [Bosea sp. BE271]
MADIRVLIVEDDPFIAMDIETAVAEQLGDGVELIVVESVAEAHRMTAQQLACALLDIDVVGGKTFDVASTLQESGTPFAFVSGSAPHEVPATLRSARFLRKPFSTREVAAFVKSAVGVTGLKALQG